MHLRRVASLVVPLVILVATTTSALAGGGLLPPLKLDLGSLAMRDDQGQTATGTALMVGLHWATMNPKRSAVDIGVGYVGSFLPDPSADLHSHYLGSGRVPVEPLLSAHGGYIELAVLAHERPHLRTWISGRGELLQSGDVGVLGMATRVSTELWTGLFAGSGGAGILGVAAIGLWAEVGVRELPSEGLARMLSAGISGRLPLVIAAH